jgi:ankyrin repeat protein
MFPEECGMDSAYELAMDSLPNTTSDEITSLCDAIIRNDEQSVRDMSKLLHGDETLIPKREAINRRKPQILRILLSEDETLDESLMTTACESRQRDVISTLVEHGWPINKALSLNKSPLWSVKKASRILALAKQHCRLAVGDIEFMRWLISLGADVNARSMFGQSTLSKAIVDGDMGVVDLLLGQEEQEKDIDSDLLHCAAQRSDKAEGAIIATRLVELGARVDAHHYDNNNEMLQFRWFSKRGTPLHTACSEENIPVAEVLLRHGANPYALMLEQDRESGPTPVEIAEGKVDAALRDMLMAQDVQSRLKISYERR